MQKMPAPCASNRLAHTYLGWLSDYCDVDGEDPAAFLVGAGANSIPGILEEVGHWAAVDLRTGERWHPMRETYRSFKARCATAEPYVSSTPVLDMVGLAILLQIP